MDTELKIPRLNLRRFSLCDFENMRELESDPLVMKNIPKRVPQTPEETKETLRKLVEKTPELHPFGVWAAELKDDHSFIGWFMLMRTDLDFPELGFMTVRKHWGKNYASEVSRGLIEYGFNHLKLEGICARTDHDNHGSIRVLEKLGFKLKETKKNAEGRLVHFFLLKQVR